MIETVEQAVQKINEVKWRGRSDWCLRAIWVQTLKPSTELSYESEDAIRIARSYELEEELEKLLTQHTLTQQRSNAWDAVWDKCKELGMETNQMTGLGDVLYFITELSEEVKEKNTQLRIRAGWSDYLALEKQLIDDGRHKEMQLERMTVAYQRVLEDATHISASTTRFQSALKRISNFKDCRGIDCPFCDSREWEDSSDSDHPFTAEALIAQEALK